MRSLLAVGASDHRRAADVPLNDWLRPIPSVRATVSCSGVEHELLWRRGALVTLDHDQLAERTLGSLGGELPHCVEVADVWRGGPPLLATRRIFVHQPKGSGPIAHVARRPSVVELPLRLRRLHQLATALHAGAPVDALLLASLRDPVQIAPSGHRLRIEPVPGFGPPRLSARFGRRSLQVSARWLARVWVRELGVVEGGLVVDAARQPGVDGRLEVSVLGTTRSGPALRSVRLEGRW